MNEIASYLIGKVVDYLPSFILARLFPPKTIAQQVEIRLRSETPICITLEAEVPRIDLYFEITNLSHVDLVLDRLLIDFWFGQPTFQGAVLKHYAVPSRKSVNTIRYSQVLTVAQQKQSKQYIDNSITHGQILIYLTAYLESKVGVIEVQKNIERSKI